MKSALIAALVIVGLGLPTMAMSLSKRFRQLTRRSKWELKSAKVVSFNAHHPQGMVRVGNLFFVSSVEVTRRPQMYAEARNGMDREPGAGVGHLFKFDGEGRLIGDLRLGEGTIYHPGGIDYDGANIWVPVAEYRPDSFSIVYRVDPATMTATEAFRFPDHLGTVIHERESGHLHAASWGSRRLYRWASDPQGRFTQPPRRRDNSSFYIDYQDCHFVGSGQAICGGLSEFGKISRLNLGGLELISLANDRPIHQIPLELWTESGQPMTRNPFWVESAGLSLRFWFMPADGRSTLYCYEATP